MINFDFDHNKALQVLAYFNRKNIKEILTTIFLADIYHINKFGRFVCGGSYYATIKGIIHLELDALIEEFESIDIPLNILEFSTSDLDALDVGIRNLNNKELVNLHYNVWNRYYKLGEINKIPIEDLIEDESIKKDIEMLQNESKGFNNLFS